MAIGGKEVILYIRKGLLYFVRNSYKSARQHPLLSVIIVLVLILYRSFPSLFAFLLSSSPVIVCTALLLGTLLSYGTPNVPQLEEDKKTQEISSLKVDTVVGDVVVKEDETFKVETHVEASAEVNQYAVEGAAICGENETLRDLSFAAEQNEGDQKCGIFADVNSLVAEDKKEMHHQEKVAEERVVSDHHHVENRDAYADKQAEGGWTVGEDGSVSITDQQEIEGLTVHISRSALENPFDSSLGSPWQTIDSREVSSGSESDGSESSSPDASMADIMPMLDELHPLLVSDAPQPALKSIDNSDAASTDSSEDHESDNGSADKEVGNKEDEDNEARESKDDGNDVAVSWTEDDQKNFMVLGISELERNRRLESLIAKRRARKLQRFETEKNLIDLDSYYPTSMASISAPRHNPFDLPYGTDVNMGLPVPGSAPSVMQPRRNPFDFPYASLSREYLCHHDFVPVPQSDVLSQRQESSSSEATLSADLTQRRENSEIKPYFVAERMDSEETGFAEFQRQLSDNADSKLGYISASDTVLSSTGQEDHKEALIEPEVRQTSEALSHANDDVQDFVQGSQSSREVDPGDAKQEQSGIDVGDGHAIDLYSTTTAEPLQAADSFGAMDDELMQEEITEVEDSLPALHSGNLDVIEEIYGESVSSSSESNEMSSRMSIHEESANKDPIKDEFMQSERTGDSQTADPVYDSSPPAIEKTLSNISAHDAAMVYEGKEGIGSSSSLVSDLHAAFTELDSHQRPLENYTLLQDKDFISVSESMGENYAASGSGGLCATSSALSSVMSKEAAETKEHDFLEVHPSKVDGDFPHQTAAAVPESDAGQSMLSSSTSPVNSDLSEEHLVTIDKNLLSEGDEMIDGAPSAENFVLSVAGFEHSQVSMPSIAEENLEDYRLEKEHERMTVEPPANSGSAGSFQAIEEPIADLSNIEKSPPLFDMSSEEIGNDVDTVPELKNTGASLSSPLIQIHDIGATLEPIESIAFSDDIENEVQSKEGGSLNKPKDLDEESDDDVHAEMKEIKEIDEGLLSELDAVGDFHVGKFTLKQGVPEEKLQYDGQENSIMADSSTGMQEASSELQFSGATSIIDAMSLGVPSEPNLSNESNAAMDPPEAIVSEVKYSIPSSGVDPEMTVYNSKLRVLAACSDEEIDSSVFKQYPEEVIAPPSEEVTVNNSLTSSPEAGTSGLDAIDRQSELTQTDSELLVLEARSVEDISSALKQLSEGGLNKPTSEAEPSDVPTARTHLEPGNSDLMLVEASLEERSLASEHLTEGMVNSTELIDHKDGLNQVEARESHLEPEITKVESAETSERHIDAEVIEIQSGEVMEPAIALEKLNEGDLSLNQTAFSEAEPSDFLQASTHLEPTVSDPSIEEKELAFERISEGTMDFTELMEYKDGLTEVEESESHLEPEMIEVRSAETSERHFEPATTETQTAEEIELAFGEDVDREMAVKKDAYLGNEAIADVSSSSSLKLKNPKKKYSQSSSSSSSSDSE